MSTQTNQKKASRFVKKLGFLGIGLCALCCALPVAGAIAGIGAFSVLAVYFEKIGLALLIASAGLLVVGLMRQRKADVSDSEGSSCSTNCACQHNDQAACTSLSNTNS